MNTNRHPAATQECLAKQLTACLTKTRTNWRRTMVERTIGALSYVMALATLLALLLLTGCSETTVKYDIDDDDEVSIYIEDADEYDSDDEESSDYSEATVRGTEGCIPAGLRADAPKLAMVSAGAPSDSKVRMMREALESYLGATVESATFETFDITSLGNEDALVIYGDSEIKDDNRAKTIVDAAQRAEKSVIWIGLGVYSADEVLDVTLNDEGVAFEAAPKGAVLVYNGAEVSARGLLMAEAVVGSPAQPMETLAIYRGPRGNTRAAVSERDDFLHIGFDPLEGFIQTKSLIIAMDLIADVVNEREADPKVIFRLEDLNAYSYGDDDTILPAVGEYLLENDVFLHLAVIPEYINADGTIEGDVGDMPTLLQLLTDHPDNTIVVQHGYRHQRDDPRNAGKASGVAYEFFYDDEEKLGPEKAAALARDRMTEGRRLMELHLQKTWAFEAPHYEMSYSQEQVAEEAYDLILHAPLHQGESISSTELYWLTIRNNTAYGPSSAGYVDMSDPASIDSILEQLSIARKLIADPTMIVYFHPELWAETGGKDALERLITGIKGQGYRFVSACDMVTSDRN